jgi:hypothetical protein
LKGDEEAVVDMSVDELELLGGDGNGSEDDADQMSDDENDGIGAAWKETDNFKGLDHMPSRSGGHNQHLRSQKFKHIYFVLRGSSGGAVSGRTLTSLLRCIPNLTVAWSALGLPGGKRL